MLGRGILQERDVRQERGRPPEAIPGSVEGVLGGRYPSRSFRSAAKLEGYGGTVV